MFGLFKKKLPDCDKLFKIFLTPWYKDENPPTMIRPDMYVIVGYEGYPIDLDAIQYLPAKQLEDTKKHMEVMIDAALQDFQRYLKADELNLDVLDAVDKFHDRAAIQQIIDASDPKDWSNKYLVTICEFGAMLGKLFTEREGFEWLYSEPYFHSIIVHKNTGFGITVFDWAVQKFSEYGVDDEFVAKFETAFDMIKKQEAGGHNNQS